MEMTSLIICVLVGGIIGTFLLELKGKHFGKRIEYKSIFPNTKDDWTNNVLQTMVVSRGTAPIYSDSQLSSGTYVDDNFHHQSGHDPHDPYTNPGLDIVVDESYHGIDHGSGIHDAGASDPHNY
ncbi:hypothetical protein SAMN05216389_103115 [Oceanobacillus limi]|uniref:Uncharacterized protein n=1 Tax=Oceanobacillus limi TaxID=930131 RepID=A0A1I0A7X9_9BACI|nr:hypothetical protein [Oceanobacillus limi]SES90243.1 hypothetical protein SAMN05216389_103115 [Oceanobacillus limi]